MKSSPEKCLSPQQGSQHLNPNIMTSVKMEMPPAKSFDEARAELERLKQKSKALGGITGTAPKPPSTQD